MTENQIGTAVVELAIEIHRELGPGLYENVYETVLAYELESHGLSVVCQVPVPIRYKHLEFQEGFKADMIVNDKVILELKSVEATYLRLKGFKLGYLLNFGEALMKDGIYRIVNNLEEDV